MQNVNQLVNSQQDGNGLHELQAKNNLNNERVHEENTKLITDLQNSIFELKDKITQMGLRHLSLEEKLSDILKKQQERSQCIEDRIEEKTEEIKSSHLNIVDKLEYFEKKLECFERQSAGILGKIKRFLQPRVGRLYQYEPRLFIIPEHYFNHAKLDNYPTISIVTPSFNQGDFLERTILSVIGQKYPALEYIVQDGESNDDSVKVIKHYESSLKHWASAKDKGQSHAINLGFRHATGEIMAYLNSDDILLPGTLNYVANYFNKHPDVDVVYGHRVLINEADHEIGRWVLPPHCPKMLAWADYVPQETLFWRRRIWEKVGGKVDENFFFAMDWDLLTRFADAGAKFVRLPRFLGAFRVHSNQKTSAQISKAGMAEMERLRIRMHGRLVTPHEISQHTRKYLTKHVIYNKLYRLGILQY